MAETTERREKLLTKLDAAWADFHDAYAGLDDEALLEPGVTGTWSIRDLIAHIAWWEEEAIEHLPIVLEGGRPPRYSVAYGGIDAFNALKTEEKRHLSLDEVREDATATHARLVAYIRDLPLGALVSGTRARRRLQLDTFGHYPIHAADIRAWREAAGR